MLRKDWLKQGLKVSLAVNKCESDTVGNIQSAEFWKLGLGEPHPVSAIHGTGVAELLDIVAEGIVQVTEEEVEQMERDSAASEFINVAIVGRPNVGKSSLFNRLFGEARAIVSDVAGTTRDTLDAELILGDKVYTFIDTAGIRKKGKVRYGAEFFMVNRAMKVGGTDWAWWYFGKLCTVPVSACYCVVVRGRLSAVRTWCSWCSTRSWV